MFTQRFLRGKAEKEKAGVYFGEEIAEQLSSIWESDLEKESAAMGDVFFICDYKIKTTVRKKARY